MGSLVVRVLNRNGKTVENKKVFCNFVGLIDTNKTEYTDDDGLADFGDVPVGKVEVIIDGKKQLVVGVGQNDHEEVTVTT